MNVAYSPAAERDLEGILDYTGERNSAAAARLAAKIRYSISRLERFPFSAPKRRRDDARILVIPRTPYFAIYQVELDRVVILRIYHGAQNVPR